MSGLQDFRAKHPEYDDMPDEQLAGALHRKFYSDMPFEDFATKLGIAKAHPEAPKAQEKSGAQPESWAQLAYRMTPLGAAQSLYQAAQHPANTLQALDDSARMIANGATFGYADKFAGYMNGTGTEAERTNSDQSRERLGAAGPALEVAGSLVPATKAAKLGITAARIPGAVGKYGGMILDGSAFGALDAAGHDRSVAQGAGIGGLLGLGGQVVGKGIETAYNKVRSGPVIKDMLKNAPSFDDVATHKNALYSALDNGGVKFDSYAYDQMLSDTSAALKNFRSTKAPMTADTVNYMMQFRGQSPTFRDVEDILQEAKGILRERNATDADKKAAGIVVDNLSRFFDTSAVATNGSIAAGDVSGMVKQARDLARRHIMAKDVLKMQDKAEWYPSGDESGLRNQFASYGKKSGKSLTKMEREAAKSVVRREGLLSGLNQAGTKLGQIALASTGFATGGLPGVALATGGHFIARKASEKVTEKAVNNYIKTVLAGRSAQNAAAQKASLLSLQPDQTRALQAALRAGSLGLLGLAAQ